MQSLVTFFCAENASKSVETNGLSSGFKFHCQSCQAVAPSCSIQNHEKLRGGSHGGDVNLIPRQNMRCGEKRVEIVTFRRGLLKKEVRSFNGPRRSSLRRKERSLVQSGTIDYFKEIEEFLLTAFVRSKISIPMIAKEGVFNNFQTKHTLYRYH